MKKLFIPLMAAMIALAPAPVFAQSAEDMVLGQTGTPDYKRGSPAAAAAMYGEQQVQDGMDYSEGQDPEMATDDGISYDQAAIGQDGAQDIYSYVGRERNMDPTARRQMEAKKAHDAELKRRKEVLGNMKSNSEKYLKEQKIRAWKLAHPGEEYPSDGEEEEGGAADPYAAINEDGQLGPAPVENDSEDVSEDSADADNADEGYSSEGGVDDGGGEVAVSDMNESDAGDGGVDESGAGVE